MNGNKININMIGTYETTLAKCGLLSLVWIGSPIIPFNRFEIRSGEKAIFATTTLEAAIRKYNSFI